MKIIGHISVGDIDYTSGIPRKDELTLEEFQRMLQTKELRELFQAVDVDVNDAESLFRLLDMDETGTLSPQELVDGWFRLRGPAKALDLAVLMADSNRMDAKLDWLCEVTQQGHPGTVTTTPRQKSLKRMRATSIAIRLKNSLHNTLHKTRRTSLTLGRDRQQWPRFRNWPLFWRFGRSMKLLASEQDRLGRDFLRLREEHVNLPDLLLLALEPDVAMSLTPDWTWEKYPRGYGEVALPLSGHPDGDEPLIVMTIAQLREDLADFAILDLRAEGLTALPESFGLLEVLQGVCLSDNRLTFLPDSFGQLQQLQELNLSNNEHDAKFRWNRSNCSSVPDCEKKPFMAFSGSGLLLGYFHGIVTYIRDHFYVENLQLSGISGGCSTILALAMGIDLYQILLLGLHMKQIFLKKGIYWHDFEDMVEFTMQHWKQIGISDEDVAELAARKQCHIGVTKCFPPGHCCIETPHTLRDLVALVLSSMSVVPFFRTPGIYEGKYYIDGGFSAMYSVPPGQRWDEVIKVTCFPWWATLFPPALGIADIQPYRFMPTEVFVLYPWEHQRELIKQGYEDAKLQHDQLVARGLRPLPNAPLTPWSEWESLFAGIDENNLPPLSSQRSTVVASEMEKHHYEVLRTFSQYNDFKALPESVCELTSLTSLDASGNELRWLPSGIGSEAEEHLHRREENNSRLGAGELINLKDLGLAQNQLSELPPIFRLQKLQILDLQHNPELTSVSEKRSRPAILERRNAASLWLATLLKFGELRDLRIRSEKDDGYKKDLLRQLQSDEPYFSDLQLRAIPSSLKGLTTMRQLKAKRNEIEAFPAELCSLKKLGLPSNIGKLECLTELDLSNNLLVELPESLGDLTRLARPGDQRRLKQRRFSSCRLNAANSARFSRTDFSKGSGTDKEPSGYNRFFGATFGEDEDIPCFAKRRSAREEAGEDSNLFEVLEAIEGQCGPKQAKQILQKSSHFHQGWTVVLSLLNARSC
eukprot:g15796.t1